MPFSITFDKCISIDEILKKTKLDVFYEKNNVWLIDELGKNRILANTKGLPKPMINGLSRIDNNNITTVLNILIEVFQVRFITDNEINIILYHKLNLEQQSELFNQVMIQSGYKIENGKIISPIKITN